MELRQESLFADETKGGIEVIYSKFIDQRRIQDFKKRVHRHCPSHRSHTGVSRYGDVWELTRVLTSFSVIRRRYQHLRTNPVSRQHSISQLWGAAPLGLHDDGRKST